MLFPIVTDVAVAGFAASFVAAVVALLCLTFGDQRRGSLAVRTAQISIYTALVGLLVVLVVCHVIAAGWVTNPARSWVP